MHTSKESEQASERENSNIKVRVCNKRVCASLSFSRSFACFFCVCVLKRTAFTSVLDVNHKVYTFPSPLSRPPSAYTYSACCHLSGSPAGCMRATLPLCAALERASCCVQQQGTSAVAAAATCRRRSVDLVRAPDREPSLSARSLLCELPRTCAV